MTTTPSSHHVSTAPSDWYMSALEHLVIVVQELSLARDLDTIMNIVREAARDLTGADGATFVLREGEHCYYAEENAISPLWKGQRFPMSTCISGWVMIHAKPATIDDIYVDDRIPHDAYRPTFVKSLVMVPIRKTHPIGAIGNYWSTVHVATNEEISILEALANVTSIALENADLYGQLKAKLRELEVANFELGRFAWIVSHDLKSPLQAIDHLAQWIQSDSGIFLKEENKLHLQYLRLRVERMSKLLDDMLTFSSTDRKTDAAGIYTVDAYNLNQDINSLIDVPHGFHITIDPGIREVRVPQIPFRQVLFNLIKNAIDHHDRPDGSIKITMNETPDLYTFSVSDDGPRISDSDKATLFDQPPLQDRKQAGDVNQVGRSLGMAFTKKILALYKGDISVNSGHGRGNVFEFTWPKIGQGILQD